MPELQELSLHHQTFLCLLALKEEEGALELCDTLIDPIAGELREALGNFLAKPKKLREEEARRQLEKLGKETPVSLWQHCDGGWVVNALRGESARIWALVFRELPRTQVGRVLAELPKEQRKAIKAMSQQPISAAIWKDLKCRMEAQFPSVPQEIWQNLGDFAAYRALPMDQFLQLMRELGLAEMAVAFSRVDKTATRAILHRLGVEEAKDLRGRIKNSPHYTAEQTREAQINILSLEAEKLKTDELTLEIGFNVFSRAFEKQHMAITPIFVYKLAPRYGYLLKRYFDLNVSRSHPEKARRVRQQLALALEKVQLAFGA